MSQSTDPVKHRGSERMVTFKKKNSADSEPPAADAEESRNNHGVQGRGNAFRDAVIVGLAVALIPALLGIAYLNFVRAPAQKADMLEHVAQSYAQQQAQNVSRSIAELRERVRAAVASPTVLSALESRADAVNRIAAGTESLSEGAGGSEQTETGTENIEALLSNFFPEAIGVRVLPLGELGTADLGDNRQGLRNHI
ncbi:MAG: hypothetical protein Cons2KO_02810 [Congregibacter sp.]